MTELSRGLSKKWAALALVSLALLSAQAGAQTPPTEPPAGGQPPTQPPTDPPVQPSEQAPPAPEATKPTVTYPTVLPTRDIKLTEHFAIRFGLQAQVWYEMLQDATETDGEQANQLNFFCRRCRILTAVQPWDNITLNILLEATNLGRGTVAGTAFSKNFSPNLAMLDAYANIKFSEAVQLDFGLMLVPLSRNVLQGTTTYIGLDINFTSAQHINALQTTVLRDLGLMVRGYVAGEKLGYRLGVFSGVRDAPGVNPGPPPVPTSAPNENLPMVAGYLQYNIFDVDKGYVYNGNYYGRKKIAGVAVGGVFQASEAEDVDPAMAFSAAAFLAWPLAGANKAGGDEVHALAQFVRYDGGNDPGMNNGTAPGLKAQNDFAVEAGYYNRASKLSVFAGFEARMTAEDADKAVVPSQMWIQGGLKYHLVDNLLNFTLAYKRSQFNDLPDGSPLKSFNQFVLAAQALYF